MPNRNPYFQHPLTPISIEKLNYKTTRKWYFNSLLALGALMCVLAVVRLNRLIRQVAYTPQLAGAGGNGAWALTVRAACPAGRGCGR